MSEYLSTSSQDVAAFTRATHAIIGAQTVVDWEGAKAVLAAVLDAIGYDALVSERDRLRGMVDDVLRWLELFQRSTAGSWLHACAICGVQPEEDHRKDCEFAKFLNTLRAQVIPQNYEEPT